MGSDRRFARPMWRQDSLGRVSRSEPLKHHGEPVKQPPLVSVAQGEFYLVARKLELDADTRLEPCLLRGGLSRCPWRIECLTD